MTKTLTIHKEFSFAAAHRLPCVPPGHKCSALHGHEWVFRVGIGGPVDKDRGWIIDFGLLKQVVNPIVDQLDHHYLNDVPGLGNPTAENIVHWLWDRIQEELVKVSVTAQVCEVTVYETPTSFATLKL